jgi:hypothetical protein
MTAGHVATEAAVLTAVVANNGFAWPLLTGRPASLDLADPRTTCTAYMRLHCGKPASVARLYNDTLMFEFTRATFHNPFPLPFAEQDVAMFMLVRGPYAYIGHSWMGCIQPDGYVAGNTTKGYERPPQLDVDYGEPVDLLGSCAETVPGKSGVFEREWTKASVRMDCNEWEATIKMK